jgi:hypothetical protein
MSYLIDNGAHIDKVLSNLAVKAFAGMEGFIADALFPQIPVNKQSDKYYIIDPDTYLRVHDTKRAPGTSANKIEFKLTSESYFADNYALGTNTPLEALANADLGGAMVRVSNNEIILDGLARDREVRVASIVTSISNVGSGVALTGANKWSDGVGSDPIGDVNTAHAFIRGRTGLVANTMAIDFDTLVILQHHPAIRDYVKYTQEGAVPVSQLLSLFRVKRFAIAEGIKNGAKEGATASMTNIWGNFAALAVVNPGVSMQTKTFGAQFNWRPEGFPAPMVVERYPHHDKSTKQEVQEAQYFADEKVIARDLCYVINDTL